MLPQPKSFNFPDELKRIRLSLKMNREEFALAAKINKHSPRRYEEVNAKDFTIPRKESWEAIAKYLDSIKYFGNNVSKFKHVTAPYVPRPKLVMPVTKFKSIWQPVNGRIYDRVRAQCQSLT